MATAVTPTFTGSVNQEFFIEAQGGSRNPINLLDRFPDAVYSKAVDSVLVTFLYALLGPMGAGGLRQEFLKARLQFEEAGLSAANLDSLYTSPFAFARLADETYELDAGAALLSSDERAQILAGDAAFRNRAIDFLKGVRAGGTLQGLELVAKSGLNRPVDLIENYRALYDQYCDIQSHLPYMGTTASLNEVIVLPRQDAPQSAQQSLVLTGDPITGWFTLTLPLGPNYQIIQVGTTNGSNIITVPNAKQIPPGGYVSITSVPGSVSSIGSASPTTYAMSDVAMSPTSIALVFPPQSPSAGQPFNMTSTGNFWAYVGQAETVLLPSTATAVQVQSALQALPVVGHNIRVTGGPLPAQPVTIQFTNALADRPTPALQVNLAPTVPTINGLGGPSAPQPLGGQMVDVTGNPLTINATVTNDRVGVSADSQTNGIAPGDEHAMQVALDEIRPITSFVTTQQAQGVTQRQPANTIFAGSAYTEVLRYETGNASVSWPSTDATHWIESGIEHEAPRPVGDLRYQYQGFHNVQNIQAYTEAALSDPSYMNPVTPLWQTYWDVQVGRFSPTQVALYPFLASYQDPTLQFTAAKAVAQSPDPLVITDSVNGTGVINGIYPTDYLGLPGVSQLPTTPTFWASSARAPDSTGDPSVDYLEVDLGTTQALNYLYFEATNKPYIISVAYDIFDQGPVRQFVPVTLMPSGIAPSITSLAYNATMTNPWSVVEIHCTNALNQMIFTRYIRIGFRRTPANTPFAPPLQSPVPYSIEVRNLRIGRNLASSLDRVIQAR